MDNLEVALPSSSTAVANQVAPFAQPLPQRFSLPYPIIYHIIKNPKYVNGWNKLIRTCKHFYSKNPVLLVNELYAFDESLCKADDDVFNASEFIPTFWVRHTFVARNPPNIASILIPRMFKFDLRVLRLYDQVLSLDDYRKLTWSGATKHLVLNQCCIIDGSDVVTVDKVLENLHEIEKLEMQNTASNNLLKFSDGTVKRLVGHLKEFKKLRCFELYGIPAGFEFEDFKDFLFSNHSIKIYLSFCRVPAVYKEMVIKAVKEIKINPLSKVPNIRFC